MNAPSRDYNVKLLHHLSNEVSRIAATLAELSFEVRNSSAAVDLPPLSAEPVRAEIRRRRLRREYIDGDLLADPAWDMMLCLLEAEISQRRVPVSVLCNDAAVPQTTAIRWIKSLTLMNVFIRTRDLDDGRRVFVELAPSTSAALRRYFLHLSEEPLSAVPA